MGSPQITRRWHSPLAWGAAGLCCALTAAGLALQVVTLSTPVPLDFGSREASAVSALAFLALPVLGALIASRRPEVRLAWMFIAIGATMAIWVFADGWAVYALLTEPGSLPGGRVMAWLANWLWIPGWGLTGMVFLLFPDGRLPSPRWRSLAWALTGVAGAFSVATMVTAGPLANYRFVDNPWGLLEGDGPTVKAAGTLALLALGLVLIPSLVGRMRRAEGDQRQQFRWIAFAATLVIGLTALGWTLFALGVRFPLAESVVLGVSVVLPLAAAVAVLRYRLYDIDVVINKTLVYGSLAGFVTVVYVAIVVGLGNALGQPGEPDLALSIAATAAVALAFEPLRRRAQAVANRLVYGQRATPYDVLADFSRRMGELPTTDQLLGRMAQLLGEATGAARAEVWLRFGDELRPAASWPEGVDRPHPVPLPGDEPALPPGSDVVIPVRHHGDLLGALSVTSAPGDAIRPIEARLVEDLASQAGHVLRNVGLTQELMARLEDLRASRQRLVAAQDEERRRLERDLHDGAQQYLVALRVQLGLAAQLAGAESEDLRSLLEELRQTTDEAVDALRALARGIYPPLLASQGLEAALKEQGRRSVVPVEVVADGLGRYPEEVEAAVYFCCLEALQNVAKYSQATTVRVELSDSSDGLVFTVEDDGKGFDPEAVPRGSGLQNMSDRLEALGGSLRVDSAPGRGTHLTGSVPAAVGPERPAEAVGSSLV